MKNPKLCPSAIFLQLRHLVEAGGNGTTLVVSPHTEKKISYLQWQNDVKGKFLPYDVIFNILSPIRYQELPSKYTLKGILYGS